MRDLENEELSYSEDIANTVIDYLDSHDFHYSFHKERGVISMQFSLQKKIAFIQISIIIHKNSFSTFCILPFNVEKKMRLKVSEFLTRANYGLRNGNFEMDFNDGEIRYKIHYFSQDHIPLPEDVEKAIFIGVNMCQQYGDELISVMFNDKSPLLAVFDAENNDDDDEEDEEDNEDDDDEDNEDDDDEDNEDDDDEEEDEEDEDK